MSGLLFLSLVGCATGQAVPSPRATIERYMSAIESGDSKAVYALLDKETRETTSFEDFDKQLKANKPELSERNQDIDKSLNVGVNAKATVRYESGERAVTVLEDSRWQVLGGVLDAPALNSPVDAVLALRRALQRQSIRGVMRVLSRARRSELQADIKDFIEETEDELDLKYEIRGNLARVRTSGGREVLLVRESGEWRVLDVL